MQNNPPPTAITFNFQTPNSQPPPNPHKKKKKKMYYVKKIKI